MKSFYAKLDPYIKRTIDTENVFENAVVSGAGLVVSSKWCKENAPFTTFGADFEDTQFGDPIDGNVNKNVMWIDDQILADLVKQKRNGKDYPKHSYTLEAETYTPKMRDVPNNLLFYTLQVYMPTLFSGFILKYMIHDSCINTCLDRETLLDNIIKNFSILMPKGSIGEYYCQNIERDDVNKTMDHILKILMFQRTLNDAWSKLWINPTFTDAFRRTILNRITSGRQGKNWMEQQAKVPYSIQYNEDYQLPSFERAEKSFQRASNMLSFLSIQ